MNKPGMIKEFARTAMDYGQALYQHQQSLELLKRQKSSLANLRRWRKKPETRKVSVHARELLGREILETQERIKADVTYSKFLAGKVARLKSVLEMKTRRLVAAE